MTGPPQVEVTQLLAAIGRGDVNAQERLFRLLYRELHGMATDFMREERVNHTLQPSALVNEAVLRLLDQGVLRKANNRRYLFDTIAKVMRQILVDYARARSAHKRGRDWQRKSLEAVVAYFEERHLDMCELDRALKELAAVHERQSKVVTLRVFADLAWQDLAEQLHVSVSTAKGDFRLARAWLHERLGGEIDDS